MTLYVFSVVSALLTAFSAFQIVASLPIIDVAPLFDETTPDRSEKNAVINAVGQACRENGFFYAINHGVADEFMSKFEEISRKFFDYPLEHKKSIEMKLGGKAWRGYFSVGEELTSGIADLKEGIYFGSESSDDRRYLHGPNLWPAFANPSETMKFQIIVRTYMEKLKFLGDTLMRAIIDGLKLPNDSLKADFEDPTELFRIFNYPAVSRGQFNGSYFGVGEHTDYGFITILYQDQSGGLQIKKSAFSNETGSVVHNWVDVPPLPNSFVINLGDALERATGGLFKATPHRVLQNNNAGQRSRLSFPYFFDPDFDSPMVSVFDMLSDADKEKAISNRRLNQRWDNLDPSAFQGTYGDYLLRKVSKVFPELAVKTVLNVQPQRTESSGWEEGQGSANAALMTEL